MMFYEFLAPVWTVYQAPGLSPWAGGRPDGAFGAGYDLTPYLYVVNGLAGLFATFAVICHAVSYGIFLCNAFFFV